MTGSKLGPSCNEARKRELSFSEDRTTVAIDLVIFDCDGVLVDSEVISSRAHADTLTHHGYPITPDQILDRFLGVSDRAARPSIEAEIGRELPRRFRSPDEARRTGAPCPRSAADLLYPPAEMCRIEWHAPSARAGGMTVLGFYGGSHCRPGHDATLRAAGAHATFEDRGQLPALIGQMRQTGR